MQYPEIEAYLVVFSLTDSQSFRYACDVLRLLKHHSRTDAAVILVGNKSDLVRGRRVSDDGLSLISVSVKSLSVLYIALLSAHRCLTTFTQ